MGIIFFFFQKWLSCKAENLKESVVKDRSTFKGEWFEWLVCKEINK